jgi:hypothetical protein
VAIVDVVVKRTRGLYSGTCEGHPSTTCCAIETPERGLIFLDTVRTRGSRKDKGSVGANRLTLAITGSSTWARTRDLRINSRSLGSGCRPRRCSLCGSSASNMFWSVSSISTGLERRIDHWILESFPRRMSGCSAVPSLDLGMAGEQLHALASRQPSPAPIPPEFLGAWRRAGENAPSKVASDYSRFQLLTGCRGVEIRGHKLHEYPSISRSGSGTSTTERAGAAAGHEEPERSQAAAVQAGAFDCEAELRWSKGG